MIHAKTINPKQWLDELNRQGRIPEMHDYLLSHKDNGYWNDNLEKFGRDHIEDLKK